MSDAAAQIFLSYSRKDDHYRGEISPHLGVLKSRGIKVWTDRTIRGSEVWDSSIMEALERARIVVLLVSANSLSSDYILKEEVSEQIRAKRRVYPILIRACAWRTVDWLAAMQIRPVREGRITPIAAIPTAERDDIYAGLVGEIAGILEEAPA